MGTCSGMCVSRSPLDGRSKFTCKNTKWGLSCEVGRKQLGCSRRLIKPQLFYKIKHDEQFKVVWGQIRRMSLTSFIGIAKIELRNVKKCYFRPLNWLPFPEVRVTWGQIRGQGAPYPYLSFVEITKTQLEKSANMWFKTLEMAAIVQGQSRLRLNLRTRCPLPSAKSLPWD